MTLNDIAWRQTEPPDHHTPSLSERIEHLTRDDLEWIITCLADDTTSDDLASLVKECERNALDGLTP